MAEKSSIKIGSRVKVLYKTTLNKELVNREFKGEIYSMPNKNQVNLIGFITDNPTVLVTLKLMNTEVITIGGTRLPKYFSDLLTAYVAKLRKVDKAKEDMVGLKAKQELYDKDLQQIKENLPREYADNEKSGVSAESLTHLIYNEFKYKAKTDLSLLDSMQILLVNFSLGNNLFGYGSLTTTRDSVGNTSMNYYTQKDVLNYLWYKEIGLKEPLDVSELDQYFDTKHAFKAQTKNRKDGTFSLTYFLTLKLKDTVTVNEIPAILNALIDLDNRIQALKIKD